MAPKIKLQRVGAKNQPKYRVIIQEAREKVGGKLIEILGVYEPLREPSIFQVNKDKILDWIKKGAQPTEKIRILLGKAGILPPIDLASLTKRKKKAETPPEEKKAKPEALPDRQAGATEPKAEAKAEPPEEGK